MRIRICFLGLGAGILLGACAGVAGAATLNYHAFTWWDDPPAPVETGTGVIITAMGAGAPVAGAIRLLDLEEWHLNKAQTAAWYAGAAILATPPHPAPPVNPFNPANRTPGPAGLIGAIPLAAAVADHEAFIYRIANVGYVHGNGPPPNWFTFTDAPGALGANFLSGIWIDDTHGALLIALPVAQFIFTDHGVGARVLDLTPGRGAAAAQDWEFNAFLAGFEWDIPNWPGPGEARPPPAAVFDGVRAGTSAVFGYAMPGNWSDSHNFGHVHSWDVPGAAPDTSDRVNITPAVLGFSGPLLQLRKGACCGPGGCVEVTEAECESFGKYRGDETTCEEECPDPIPAVSEWGLIVMTLLLLTAGTIVLGRRRRPAAA